MNAADVSPEVPRTQCLRCAYPKSGTHDRACSRCGLHFICEPCGGYFADPLEDFCDECGRPIEQPPIPTTPARRDVEGDGMGLLAATVAAVSAIGKLLNAVKRSPNLRQLFADLGEALLAHGRHDEAVTALESALNEKGASPATFDVLVKLANVHEAAGTLGPALRRTLEAVMERPKEATVLLQHAHRLLAPVTAGAEAAWILGAWREYMRAAPLDDAGRLDATLFLARVDLLVGRTEAAFEELRTPGIAFEALAAKADMILETAALPPSMSDPAADGNTHLILARLNRVFGRLEDALALATVAAHKLSGPTGYLDAPAQRLQAEIFDALGQRQQAAERYLEAGRRYGWRREYAVAVELMGKSVALDASRPIVHWESSNALFSHSFDPEATPATRLERARASLAAWREGERRGRVDASCAWAYVLRALLARWIGELERASGAALAAAHWEAAAFAERAVLVGADSVLAWAYLGRSHRMLCNEAVAAHATAEALRLDPRSVEALDERAAILADMGAIDEAGVTIDARRAVEPNVWADVVKAFVLVQRPERRREALELVQSAIAQRRDDTWFREIRGLAYRLDGDAARAREDFAFVWDRWQHEDSSVDGAVAAWAAYCLGEIAKAKALYEGLLGDEVCKRRPPLQRGLGLCRLALGDVAGARGLLLDGVRSARSARELDEFLRSDLIEMDARFAQGEEPSPAREFLEEVRSEARRRIALLPIVVDGPVLLDHALAQLECAASAQDEPATEWREVAALAGTARLRAEREEWEEAIAGYRALRVDHAEGFPEAGLGLQRCCERLLAAGDAELGVERIPAACGRFERALDVADEIAMAQTSIAQMLVRLGCARAWLGNNGPARQSLLEAARRFATGGEADPGERLGRAMADLVRHATAFWALDDLLADGADLDVLASARRALRSGLDRILGLALSQSHSATWWPGVAPIVVELGPALVPPPPDPQWPIFESLLPGMRKRIREEWGVQVPGVRLRANDQGLAPGQFVLLIDEIPRELGDTPPPAAAHVPVASGETPPPASAWDAAHAAIVAQLERFLGSNLSTFIDLDACEALIESWCRDPEAARCAAEAFGAAGTPELATRRRAFARVLRALLDEEIPVAAGREILGAAAEVGLDGGRTDLVVEAARKRLSASLPGNRPGRPRVPVPVDVEERIAACIVSSGGRPVFAIPPEDAQEVIEQLRALVASQPPDAVLVVSRPDVRQSLRRLLVFDFPKLPVMTIAELIADETAGSGSRDAPPAEHEARAQ